MRVIVLLNGGAGTSSTDGDAVRAVIAAAGMDADVREVPGEELFDAAKQAAAERPDAVVAGGGDGTVSAVAGALAGGETPLGVLPLGTLNHFAKDLGIPLDLTGAVGVIAAGNSLQIDLGRLNDRTFLNNSSVGVYARALIGRDVQREKLGLSKWPAMVRACWKVFRRSPLLRVVLATEGQEVVRRTPMVFVGNNRYDLELFRVGTRQRLDEGVLSLYVATTHTRWGMIKLAVRAAIGRLEQSRDFDVSCVSDLRIGVRRSRVNVSLDGEIMSLEEPLEYSIWAGALRVLVPEAARTDAGAAESPASLGVASN